MATTASSEYAIEVNDVTMIFNMASEQLNSLKEYFIKLMKHELFFNEFRALKNVSFKVRPGEVVGLVGTNGSGKSTMLKVIAGVLEASEGECIVRGNIAPLIELGAGSTSSSPRARTSTSTARCSATPRSSLMRTSRRSSTSPSFPTSWTCP